MLEISSPKEVYSVILSDIEKLINTFNSDSKNEEIKSAQSEALQQLGTLQREIQGSMEQLERNSEWDVFTLAFYGETNAGKSTLIETLRILLNEPAKMEEREEFSKAFTQYAEFQKEINKVQTSINSIVDEYKDKLDSVENKVLEVSGKIQELENKIKLVRDNIEKISNSIKEEKKASFSNFIQSIFGRLPGQLKLKESKKALREIENEKKGYMIKQKNFDKEKEAIKQEQKFDKRTKELNEKLSVLQEKGTLIEEKLAANADGRIIGDGRSDFTQMVTSYNFEANNQKFALLDLPGIEGNEGLVLDAINAAVQKAHAVFYVTAQPKPPQTGDKNSEGTLDKIKKHLGQQTEVYAIFNKRVKNPNSLKENLIDSDEGESLKVLDQTMRSHLGEQYRESISLSAYPAFLAVANCWGEELPRKKEKFIECFKDPESILNTSRIRTFSEQLVGDMVNNSKAKIKKSNFKKTAIVLQRTTDKAGEIHGRFCGFEKELIEAKCSTDELLDNESIVLKQNLEREAHTLIEKFKNDVRKNIYEVIDTDIDNKTFKSALEETAEKGIENIQPVLEKTFKDQVDKFHTNVSEIVEKYQDNACELLNAYTGAEKFNVPLNMDINIKSGVNWVGTLVSVGSTLLGAIVTGPVGWVALALGVIGALISVGKAVVGFFNHNYRKSQQRKNADQVLDKTGDEILKSIRKNMAESEKPLQDGIDSIKDELTKTVNHVKELNRILEKSIKGFKDMIKSVVIEGDR